MMIKKKNSKQRLVNLIVDRYVNLELFYSKQKKQPDGCIFWTGVQNNVGYGFIGFRHLDPLTLEPAKNSIGMMTAHRLAWMITHGRLPVQRNINHTCHQKLCLNPDHLVEGSQQNKLADMRRDGLSTGRKLGVKIGAYNHKQVNKVYKYSDDEIQWARHAELDDIVLRYKVNRSRAASLRWGFRHGYRWLPYIQQ